MHIVVKTDFLKYAQKRLEHRQQRKTASPPKRKRGNKKQNVFEKCNENGQEQKNPITKKSHSKTKKTAKNTGDQRKRTEKGQTKTQKNDPLVATRGQTTWQQGAK